MLIKPLNPLTCVAQCSGEHEDCLLNAVSSCSANDGPCPVTFLPLVAVANEQRRFEQGSQQLSCRGDLPGFLSRCRGAVARVAPSPASTSSTTAAVEEAGPRCRLFETCDRAVQIGASLYTPHLLSFVFQYMLFTRRPTFRCLFLT